MIIYLHRGYDRTIAESDATATRLEASGWVRCSADVHKALWRIADATARVRMASMPAQVDDGTAVGTTYVYHVKGTR